MNSENKAALNNKPSHRLSVILVTMNRKDMLKKCLESLFLQNFIDYEVIIVDNASTDGTGEMVQCLFPDVLYVCLNANLGPPGGRNFGVRMASGEICVFIDDDARFNDHNALEKIDAYFDADQELGGLAFRIIRPQDGIEEYKSIPRVDKKIINEDYECSYFCGAGFALRHHIFSETGMFWEDLFFIGEELELSYRLIEKNYKIVRSYSIPVIHYETPQARVPGKWIFYGARNRLWIALRNLPWRYAVSHTLLWWGYYFIQSLRNRHPIYFIQGVKDAVLGLPKAVRGRACISQNTIKKLKILSGRVYY